ncbi:hypothetical protein BDN71DRAFT_697581 [Pleurotus eryngii]|uniref:Uncharacterized protein n=1 Tax=Pleurotus eryngii TaxID=5323 RepID=A0A9P6A9D0_PLEER|nr:hypothetical protein BDN71DRAFT_697581 [Pleurotus eryngii]
MHKREPIVQSTEDIDIFLFLHLVGRLIPRTIVLSSQPTIVTGTLCLPCYKHGTVLKVDLQGPTTAIAHTVHVHLRTRTSICQLINSLGPFCRYIALLCGFGLLQLPFPAKFSVPSSR